MDTLQECCRPVFGRHETFHPRWGWFSKAVFEEKQTLMCFSRAMLHCSSVWGKTWCVPFATGAKRAHC